MSILYGIIASWSIFCFASGVVFGWVVLAIAAALRARGPRIPRAGDEGMLRQMRKRNNVRRH